ncbi:hypothetical protein DFH08DRAFT_879712 [Mycena albidolilacea]|uniref:Uncharacterized protein n=1 Tax=Mycena albidolilacea TaxID=1033008 RepID=A0AAD7EKT8_9AGAR|nr:hypothetical protein DFH08DRAFT_879712 [Mycena albidolilacea]
MDRRIRMGQPYYFLSEHLLLGCPLERPYLRLQASVALHLQLLVGACTGTRFPTRSRQRRRVHVEAVVYSLLHCVANGVCHFSKIFLDLNPSPGATRALHLSCVLVDCMKGRVQIRPTPLQPRIPVEKLFIIECQPYPTDWPLQDWCSQNRRRTCGDER